MLIYFIGEDNHVVVGAKVTDLVQFLGREDLAKGIVPVKIRIQRLILSDWRRALRRIDDLIN